jgi:hypothetical protein
MAMQCITLQRIQHQIDNERMSERMEICLDEKGTLKQDAIKELVREQLEKCMDQSNAVNDAWREFAKRNDILDADMMELCDKVFGEHYVADVSVDQA